MQLDRKENNDSEKKIGTLAIDLGNCTTVVAFQEERRSEYLLLELEEICKRPGEVPSLVWQSQENGSNLLIGQQIIDSQLIKDGDKNLCSDFKRWIASPEKSNIYMSKISPEQAGEILILEIWKRIPKNLIIKRLVLTAPVETYRPYRSWLINIFKSLKVPEIALVDEPTAAAMGADLPPGSKLLVVDIGGSTIDMSIVALEGGEGRSAPIAELVRFDGKNLVGKSKQVLRCAKVLGKSGQRLGGRDIDRWILNDRFPDLIQTESNLNSAEKLKCRLSEKDIKESKIFSEKLINIENNQEIYLSLSKIDLENLLIEKGFIKSLSNLFEQTLASAKYNGCDLKDLQYVVLVGGGAQIPLIQKWLKSKSQPIELITPPPVEAIAIGALSLTPGVKVRDVLQKGVSLRCWNQRQQKHDWHPIFFAGQPWPTNQPLEIVLAASRINQLNIEIQIGEPSLKGVNEVIYINGIPTIKDENKEELINLWRNQTFIVNLNPPGKIGEDCLKLEFTINNDCKLCVKGFDIRNGNEIASQILGLIR